MTTLKIAIQKSGRLSEDSLKLFRECGIKFNNGEKKLKAVSTNFPLEFLFLRDDDIPGYVADGVADLGIIGQNVLIESGKPIDEIKRLGFSRCRLSLAVPKEANYQDIHFFEGKSIATSYPVILKKFLDEKGIRAEIHEISGSVEIAPGIGLADAICDIVSTGSTLLSNGLKEVETVLFSEAVLVGNPDLSQKKKAWVDQLIFRINAVRQAKNNKYILLNAPDSAIPAITSIIPGMKSPTIMPLGRAGWSSLHSVVNENDFWERIDKLKALGAEGILVIPIEKMIA